MALPQGIKRYFATLDYPLIVLALLCSVYGLVVCNSATAYLETNRYLYTQMIATGLGVLAMLVISAFDYETVVRYAKILYPLMVGLLALTLIIGHGDEVGSRSWIAIPGIPFNFQTAEFAKLIYAVTFASHLSLVKDKINHIGHVLLLLLHTVIVVGLVLLQGDLGSALVFIVMFMAMCFYAGMSVWYYVAALVSAVVATPIIWRFLPEYRRMRILVGFNPDLDPQNWGYQAIMSRRAISYGGVYGMGYGNGHLTSAGRVPKQQTDFAFAVLGEDFGIVGCLLALLLLTALVIRILQSARRARDDVGGYMCMGVAAMLIFQIVENIGMCLGTLPVIGIPLPFFSYGGSSLLSIYVGIGIVLAVSARRNIYYSRHDGLFLR